LDYLYLLSYMKILVTLIKYMPQVLLNFRRKSTAGWSIWQILLDFTGGVLSDAQLFLDCWHLRDWSGVTGNLAKFFLGAVSIVFDIIFMLQHYVLYPDRRSTTILEVAEENYRDDEAMTENASMTV
jgi:cystinosin